MRATPRSLLTPILAVPGAGISVYLGLASRDHHLLVCGVGDCATVQSSTYASFNGVSIAWFGLVMYLTILAISFYRASREDDSPVSSSLLVLISLMGTMYSVYLTYLELFVIDAICQWCVVSAVLITSIAITETWRYLSSDPGTP